MVADLIDSAKQSILERLSSPLLGALAISWCGWNWKFLMIVFSSTPITTTFDLINRYAFPDWGSVLLNGMVNPLFTALAYVFLYPYPARFVYEFTLRKQREMNQTKQRIAEETPLTLEESKKIRSEQAMLIKKHRLEIQELNEEIASLKESKNQSSDELSPALLASSAEKLYGQLEPTQLALMHLIDKEGGSVNRDELLVESTESKTRTEYDIGELLRKNLVKIRHGINHHGFPTEFLEFTHEGRGVLLSKNL